MKELRVAPCTITKARRVVAELHRHLPNPPRGGRFALSVLDGRDEIRGVALVGHGARLGTDRWTATVTRVATDGMPNACSMLYGATLECEPGTSLVAAGWRNDGITRGGEYDRPSRHRPPAQQPGRKTRWVWQAVPGRAAT